MSRLKIRVVSGLGFLHVGAGPAKQKGGSSYAPTPRDSGRPSRILVFLAAVLSASVFSFAEDALPPAAVSSPTASISFDRLFETGMLDSFKADRGLERSDLASEALLLKAEREMTGGRFDSAIEIGRTAERLSPASPVPHFFLARIYWRKDKTDMINILSEYTSGLRTAFSDFWFSFSMIGTFLFLSLTAVFLFFLTFFLFTILSYAPLWIHQMTEWFRGYLHPIGVGLLLFTLLFLPLIFGFPLLLFLMFIPFLFWGFYHRGEKGIALAFLASIGTAFWVLPLLCLFFAAKGSPLLNEMVKNQQEEFLWSPPVLESEGSGWRVAALQASYEFQEGNFERAQALYEAALSQNPTEPMILNNLGAVLFYRKEYPKAIEQYRQALSLAQRSAPLHYNLGQTYREMLSFDQGNQEYREAKAIDREKTEEYSRKSTLYPGRPMIEERFGKTDLWSEAFKGISLHRETSERIWRGWAGNIPLSLSPFIALFGLLSLAVSSFLFEKLNAAQFCAVCKKAICGKCQQSILDYKVCIGCRNEFKSIKKKSDLALLEEKGESEPARLYPFFILPGGGHLVMKKTLAGFVFLSAFFLLAGYAGIGELLFSSAQWRLHGAKWVWVPLGTLILYLVSLVDLLRIRSRRSWP